MIKGYNTTSSMRSAIHDQQYEEYDNELDDMNQNQTYVEETHSEERVINLICHQGTAIAISCYQLGRPSVVASRRTSYASAD